MRRTASEFRAEMANLWEVMKMNTPYGAEKDARLSLWRALFTGLDSDIPISLELAEFMQQIVGETVADTISSSSTSWSHPTLLDRLPSGMNLNDRIFSTNKGYVGKICYSDRIRNEDLVCILLGCPTPMVLRRIVDHYDYVGDVYVAGIMYGEAMDALNDGKFQLQDFVLHRIPIPVANST